MSRWIGRAIRHPGALRRALHVRAGRRIPLPRLRAAAKQGGLLGRRAKLALRLERYRRRRRSSR